LTGDDAAVTHDSAASAGEIQRDLAWNTWIDKRRQGQHSDYHDDRNQS
jgi:hypothetical protein